MRITLPVRRAILERQTYEAPAEGRKGKIRLDFNENTTGCSEASRKALARLTAKEIAMYPEYEQSSRKIARYLSVQPHEIALTNGGDEALRVFFDTFVESGDNILICEPTFPMYRYYAEIAGAHVEALRYTSEMDFPVSEAVTALRKKPKVFFLANPNNPTGTLVAKEVLRKLLRVAKHTVFVLDEAYSDFSGVTGISWIRAYPQLFIAKTFSKAAGMASLRLGAVIGQRHSLSFVRRALPPYPVNAAALAAAIAAIEEKKTISRYVAGVKHLRKWFSQELHGHGARVYPSAGNFVLVDFGKHGPSIFKKLVSRNILVRQRKELGPGFARITIGTEQELKLLLEAVPKIVRNPNE
ncbi:MAG TPA: histidinol-phosphate transaminase [Candidatus Acidoferrum sp.]|nr:histidinol-phosphate transaminase [Candidatus Acidoferrum sp.]